MGVIGNALSFLVRSLFTDQEKRELHLHRARLRRTLLCVKLTGCNAKKFGYNEQFLLHPFTGCEWEQSVDMVHSASIRLNPIYHKTAHVFLDTNA